jgi:hypothetical protein
MDAVRPFRLPAEPVIGDVEQFLAQVISDLPPDPADLPTGRRGRPRLLSSVCLWSGLLVCVLQGFSSQRELWRRLAIEGFWHIPPLPLSDQAIYTRLAQAGSQPLQTLFASVTSLLAHRLSAQADTILAPCASAVYAIDGTTLDPLARRLSDPADPPPAAATLPGKLLALFDLRRQQWRTIVHRADPQENDKLVVREVLVGIAPGALFLCDLGFFAFAWFDDLTDAGHWWVSRLRSKTSYRVLHTFYQEGDTLDQLIWLGAYRADRAEHAVRLIQYRYRGSLRRYITNVTDPHQLSLHDAAVLYARRWDIEMAIQLVKQHLGLRLWWSTNLVVVEQQLWATLLIAQVLMALRMEIATAAGVDVFAVSLPLVARYAPRYAARGEDPVAGIVRDGRLAGFIRPSRRIVIQTPPIDPARIVPAPPEIVLTHTPRYAHRRCHPVAQAI